MPCYEPMHGYRNSENGSFTFLSPDHFYEGDDLTIPCGKCLGCLKSRMADWSLRSVHELRYHEKACFATLTYREDCLPEHGDLVHRHWQLFAKRLRHDHGPFRYLMCAERGPKTNRQHLHALIFGHDFKFDSYPIHSGLRTSPKLDQLWGHGYVHLGEATGASASYVAGYVTGKLQAKLDSKIPWRPGRRPGQTKPRHNSVYRRSDPYISMSKKPGLGAPFYEEFHHEIFSGNGSIRVGQNKYSRVPQYYKNRYALEYPDLYAAFQQRARTRGEQFNMDQPTLDRISYVKHLQLTANPRSNHP